jgi:SsrA-binding protein
VSGKDSPHVKLVAQNRRARHDYLIEETLEAGMVLLGTEVKSLREGRASIAEAYAAPEHGDIHLINAHIPGYRAASRFNHEPRRPRKLLLHKRERSRLIGAVQREGVTLVPLAIYFNDRGIAKLRLGIARGKRKADKREADKARDWQRQKARLMREQGKGE